MIYRHLKPGGYLELQDFLCPSLCNNPEHTGTSKFVEFTNRLIESGLRVKLDFEAPSKWHDQLTAAGFIYIEIKWVNWPIGPWAKHEKNKIIGKFTFADMYEAIEASAKLLQNALGWEPEEVQVLIAEARNELKEQKVHLYQRVAFCYARKPEEQPSPTTAAPSG